MGLSGDRFPSHRVAKLHYMAWRPGEDDGQPARTPLLFTGQYTDPESSLQYLRARYYDPGTGQFLTRDPRNVITRTPYLYASGDPINRTDPSGLDDGGGDFTGTFDTGGGGYIDPNAGSGSDPGPTMCSVGAGGGIGNAFSLIPTDGGTELASAETFDQFTQTVDTLLTKYISDHASDPNLDLRAIRLQDLLNGGHVLTQQEINRFEPFLIKIGVPNIPQPKA